MYPPSHHLNHDRKLLLQLIELYPLATVVTPDLAMIPVPLIVDESKHSATTSLIGHVARDNPLLSRPNHNVGAIFNAADAYLSPSLYQGKHLPTWNYLTVHAKGELQILPEETYHDRMLDSLAKFEKQQASGYRMSRQDERFTRLLPHIRFIKITITSLEGHFKISADKNDEDAEIAKETLLQQIAASRQQQVDTLLRRALTQQKEY